MHFRHLWLPFALVFLPIRLFATDHPPVPEVQYAPDVPFDAYKAGIPLMATIRFLVESDGHVSHVKLMKATREDYGRSVADCVLRWKFRPAEKNGRQIGAWVEQGFPYIPPTKEEVSAALSREDQEKIVQLFAAYEPRFTQFGAAFPNTPLRIFREVYPPEVAGRVRIDADVVVGDVYQTMLWFSVRFDEHLTKIDNSRCQIFGAFDMSVHIPEGHSGTTIQFSVDEMDAFCADPVGFIKREFERSKKG